jgi:hypothetical protein
MLIYSNTLKLVTVPSQIWKKSFQPMVNIIQKFWDSSGSMVVEHSLQHQKFQGSSSSDAAQKTVSAVVA